MTIVDLVTRGGLYRSITTMTIPEGLQDLGDAGRAGSVGPARADRWVVESVALPHGCRIPASGVRLG